jgi:hypothetical protein
VSSHPTFLAPQEACVPDSSCRSPGVYAVTGSNSFSEVELGWHQRKTRSDAPAPASLPSICYFAMPLVWIPSDSVLSASFGFNVHRTSDARAGRAEQ